MRENYGDFIWKQVKIYNISKAEEWLYYCAWSIFYGISNFLLYFVTQKVHCIRMKKNCIVFEKMRTSIVKDFCFTVFPTGSQLNVICELSNPSADILNISISCLILYKYNTDILDNGFLIVPFINLLSNNYVHFLMLVVVMEKVGVFFLIPLKNGHLKWRCLHFSRRRCNMKPCIPLKFQLHKDRELIYTSRYIGIK